MTTATGCAGCYDINSGKLYVFNWSYEDTTILAKAYQRSSVALIRKERQVL